MSIWIEVFRLFPILASRLEMRGRELELKRALFDELSERDQHVQAEQHLLLVHVHHRCVDILRHELH